MRTDEAMGGMTTFIQGKKRKTVRVGVNGRREQKLESTLNPDRKKKNDGRGRRRRSRGRR